MCKIGLGEVGSGEQDCMTRVRVPLAAMASHMGLFGLISEKAFSSHYMYHCLVVPLNPGKGSKLSNKSDGTNKQ